MAAPKLHDKIDGENLRGALANSVELHQGSLRPRGCRCVFDVEVNGF